MAVAVMAIPFTDPTISGATELLMKRDVAAKQQLTAIFIGIWLKRSPVHNQAGLQGEDKEMFNKR